MSFAEDVKSELCGYVNESKACERIEVAALLRMGAFLILGEKDAVGIRLVTANNAVARRVLAILKNHFDLRTSVIIRKGQRLRKKNLYTLQVEPTVEGKKALEALYVWPVNTLYPVKSLSTMEERRAYLRGAFLGGGSVNRPQSDYHLEFMTGNQAFARDLVYVLKQFRIHARITERKESYVVYIKEGDAVTSCLQIMGATDAMMEFENVRIVKDVRNTINRQVNCETANLQKAVDAAVRQRECIRIIRRHMELSDLPFKLQEIALLRLEHGEASLGELQEIMGGRLSKSGINHRFRKLEEIALSFEPDGLAEF